MKYAIPVSSWQNNTKSTHKTNQYRPTTTLGTTSLNNYYNNSKISLISKINTYATSYTLSSVKIQELLTAFLDFFDEEAFNKDVVYSTDLDAMSDILDNMHVQFGASFDSLLTEYNLLPDVSNIDPFEEKAGFDEDNSTELQSDVSSLPTMYT